MTGVTFGPPVGEGWQSYVQWRRDVECRCGYMAWEYWRAHGDPYVICTKCGSGKRAESPILRTPAGPAKGEG